MTGIAGIITASFLVGIHYGYWCHVTLGRVRTPGLWPGTDRAEHCTAPPNTSYEGVYHCTERLVLTEVHTTERLSCAALAWHTKQLVLTTVPLYKTPGTADSRN
eukprot:79756-Rhodomonas_salina.1